MLRHARGVRGKHALVVSYQDVMNSVLVRGAMTSLCHQRSQTQDTVQPPYKCDPA